MSMNPLSRLTAIAAALLACSLPFHAADAQPRPSDREASFVVFGDHGYIPPYEQFDDDEGPIRTLGEYLALEAEDWLERNPSLDGFTPSPWTFVSARATFSQPRG